MYMCFQIMTNLTSRACKLNGWQRNVLGHDYILKDDTLSDTNFVIKYDGTDRSIWTSRLSLLVFYVDMFRTFGHSTEFIKKNIYIINNNSCYYVNWYQEVVIWRTIFQRYEKCDLILRVVENFSCVNVLVQ